MENQFIPYEQALELKALGFNEECIASYTETFRFDVLEQNGIMWHTVTNEKLKEYEKACTVPLYQQTFRWFRENHYYNCFVTSTKDKKWYYFREDLLNRKNDSEPELTPKYDTYEEAELACLKKLIEIVKNK